MKLKHQTRILGGLMVALLLVLALGTSALAAGGPPPLPAFYSGTVVDDGGSLVTTGKIKAYIEGVLKGEQDLGNGTFTYLTVDAGDTALSGKTVTFKIEVNGIEYLASSIPTINWYTSDIKEDLVVRASVPSIIHVTGVSVSPSSLILTAGGAAGNLTATVSPSNASNNTVTWQSSNPAVAAVSNGVVTPLTAGSATITVVANDGGASAACVVTVNAPVVPVTGVSVSPTSLNLTAGGAAGNLTAVVSPSNATNKTVTWQSSNQAVATVSNGSVTPLAAGSATITATTADGAYTATCTVTVIAASVPVTGVSLSPASLNLTVGGAGGSLTATVSPSNASNKALTWLSSNPAIATVSNGVVSPVTAGNAVITVTTVDGSFTATCTVTVTAASVPVSGVSLSPTSLNLTAGGAGSTLTATVSPANASNKTVSWSSSNPAVATVANGIVTPIAPGNAVITVTTVNGGYTASCTVTVTSASIPVTGVSLSPISLNLAAGGATGVLTATVSPANASNKAVTWQSSNPGVASVSNGVVTPLSQGSTVITVITADGSYSAACSITVSSAQVPVTAVTLIPTLLPLQVGDTATLTVVFTPVNATNKAVSWASSDPSVAYVSGGVVTGLKAGAAAITVTTADGNKTAICDVTVQAPVVPRLVVASPVIHEAASNDGKISEKQIVTLYNGLFDDSISTSDVIVNNLPAGLAYSAVRLSGTMGSQLEVTFLGKATNHSSSNNVNNVSVTVNASKIVTGAPTNLTSNTFTIAFSDPPPILVNGVSLNYSSLNMTQGGPTVTLVATVTPANATNKAVTWQSSNPAVATVSSGVVTPVGAGTAVITVLTVDGSFSATCVVNVIPVQTAVTSVSLSQSNLTMPIGGSATLTATVNPANASNKAVMWSSSNPGVAEVNSAGLVTAISAGNAVIIVTTVDGGKTATCAIAVSYPAVTVSPGASSSPVGQQISIILSSTGITNPEYQLWVQSSQDGTWSNLGEYNSINVYSITRNVPGTYNLMAFAKSQGADFSSAVTSASVAVTFTKPLAVSALTVSGPNGNQPVGTNATFVASATDVGGTPVYQFWVHDQTGWKAVRDYSTNNSFTLSNMQKGSYTVAVYALDQSDVASGNWSAAYYQVFVLNVGSSVVLTAPASVVSGNMVNLTATADGLTGVVYQFWYQGPDATWHSSGGYQTSSSYSFMATTKGAYKATVYAKDLYAPSTSQFAVTAVKAFNCI